MLAARCEGFFMTLCSIGYDFSPEKGNNVNVNNGVISAFGKKYNLKTRRRQRSKINWEKCFRSKLIQWRAAMLKEKLVRTDSKNPKFDPIYEMFPPQLRSNVHLVPLSFVVDHSKIYERQLPPGQIVWIAHPRNCLDRRQFNFAPFNVWCW